MKIIELPVSDMPLRRRLMARSGAGDAPFQFKMRGRNIFAGSFIPRMPAIVIRAFRQGFAILT
jgi:hypothetical protein